MATDPTEFNYLARGRLFLQQGQIEAAIRDFNDALRINPDFPVAYYCRGLAYRNAGDFATLCPMRKATWLRFFAGNRRSISATSFRTVNAETFSVAAISRLVIPWASKKAIFCCFGLSIVIKLLSNIVGVSLGLEYAESALLLSGILPLDRNRL